MRGLVSWTVGARVGARTVGPCLYGCVVNHIPRLDVGQGFARQAFPFVFLAEPGRQRPLHDPAARAVPPGRHLIDLLARGSGMCAVSTVVSLCAMSIRLVRNPTPPERLAQQLILIDVQAHRLESNRSTVGRVEPRTGRIGQASVRDARFKMQDSRGAHLMPGLDTGGKGRVCRADVMTRNVSEKFTYPLPACLPALALQLIGSVVCRLLLPLRVFVCSPGNGGS